MDQASRLARASEQGYLDTPFWRGERQPGPMPKTYENRAPIPFSREKDYADGFGRVGGHEGAREFRLKVERPFRVTYDQDVTLSDYAEILRALVKLGDDTGAKRLSTAILDEKAGPEHVFDLAARHPETIVADGFNVHRLLEKNARSANSALRKAGYDAVGFGPKEIVKLTPRGIRLQSARFDPRKMDSTNVRHALVPIGGVWAGSPFTAHPDRNDGRSGLGK
jgi:hypothetical protein